MQAFILAAGLGTRLHPLTDHRPKALVEINGVPLLRIAIENLAKQGFQHIIVNVHHYADMVCDYILSNRWEADIVVSDEREMLLDTGGALKKAEPLFSRVSPVLVYNVDILSRLELRELVDFHHKAGNMATLAVSRRSTSRYLLFNRQGLLTGWKNSASGETKWVDNPEEDYNKLAFSGISVIDPCLPSLMPPADHPYPVIPEYLEIARHHRISYFLHSPDNWLDVGTPEKLSKAQQWNHSFMK